jgi:DNA modification methylase
MDTTHRLIISDARQMGDLKDQSIDLVVTSPPYPMIKMWDAVFASLSGRVASALKGDSGSSAFEAMHRVLDPVWTECFRVLRPGGFACINIGDATRTVNGEFALYSNHARILVSVQAAGFTILPCILWRKQTNAPNKYMGSGMLPAGAYVTLEHEYILVLRKGGKRVFDTNAALRRESAIFWEERNLWFSDIWTDLKGSRQALGHKAPRQRSGAFPFELASRLILMYSVKGDTVLDPFAGTGTTMAAAMASARNSLGIELDQGLASETETRAEDIVTLGRSLSGERLLRHLLFTADRIPKKGPFKYRNQHYGFPVMTRQEKELLLSPPTGITRNQTGDWQVSHAAHPDPDLCRDWDLLVSGPDAQDRIRDIFQDIAAG